MSTYDNSFSNFGRPLVPDGLCKDSAPRHSQFWRRRFLKVFTIYGHGGQLGQWTTTILAVFCFPILRWLHMKFEHNWLRGFKGGRLKFSTIFPFKCMGLIQMHREANLTLPLKGQTSMYDNSFSNSGRPLIPNDLCKDSAPRHSHFWRRRFLKVFTIYMYGHGGHQCQRTVSVLAIFFYFPTLRYLHMKFEQNWL